MTKIKMIQAASVVVPAQAVLEVDDAQATILIAAGAAKPELDKPKKTSKDK